MKRPPARVCRLLMRKVYLGCTCVLSLFCFVTLVALLKMPRSSLLTDPTTATTATAATLGTKHNEVVHVKVTFGAGGQVDDHDGAALGPDDVAPSGVTTSNTIPGLDEDLDLGAVRKLRLKPWHDLTIIGNDDLCPVTALPAAIECPNFTPCVGNLARVQFCRNSGVEQRPDVPFRPPHDLRGKMFRNLQYTRATLPWQSDVVAIAVAPELKSIYVNHIGQVFDVRTQWLHGGCQDETDAEHGGARKYHASDQKVELVAVVQSAVNLVHWYGDNYYHFLVEVLPRFLAARPLLQRHPDLPILVRGGSPLHILAPLLGLHLNDFTVVPVSEENQLVRVEETVLMPLSQRCLHTSLAVWAQLQEEWSKQLQPRLPGLLFFASFASQYMRRVRQLSASKTTTADFHVHLPLIKIVYCSRVNSRPRRHLADEEHFITAIREAFNLHSHTFLPAQLTLAQTLQPGQPPSMAALTYYNKRPILAPASVLKDLLRSITSPDGNNGRNHTKLVQESLAHGAMFSLTVLYGNESLASTVATMAGAALLIGPHGAGLSNMVFMPRKSQTHLLELTNTGYWNPCFMYLSNALGLRHAMVVMNGTRAGLLRFADNTSEDDIDDGTVRHPVAQEARYGVAQIVRWIQSKAWTAWRSAMVKLDSDSGR